MKRKEKEEVGILLTREMLVMLKDEGLSKGDRLDVLNSVLFGMPAEGVLGSISRMLQAGYEKINGDRTRRIEKERERKRGAAREARERNGAELRGIARNCAELRGIARIKYDKVNINPYSPLEGDEREKNTNAEETSGGSESAAEAVETSEVDGGEVSDAAERLADKIEETEAYGHMRVGRRTLVRSLVRVIEKNCGREARNTAEWRAKVAGLGEAIAKGLEAWTVRWAAQGWRYAPGKVTRWLADEKWLEEPRAVAEEEGNGAEERRLGDVGVDEIV